MFKSKKADEHEVWWEKRQNESDLIRDWTLMVKSGSELSWRNSGRNRDRVG